MTEAYILCLCPSIWIPDLNIQMMKGQSVTVPADTARSSKDLIQAERNKGVSITYREEPYKELRPPIPVPVENLPAAKNLRIPDPPPVLAEKITLDEDALAQKIMDKIGSGSSETSDKIDRMVEQIENLQRILLSQPHVVTTQSGPVPGIVASKDDEVPVFIPSTIVGEDVDLRIQETVSQDTVEDTAALLKAMRKKKDKPS